MIIGFDNAGLRCANIISPENSGAGLIIVTKNNAGDRIIITDIFGVE